VASVDDKEEFNGFFGVIDVPVVVVVVFVNWSWHSPNIFSPNVHLQ
jgi:hypothetical protein